jgi:hypothetical protein
VSAAGAQLIALAAVCGMALAFVALSLVILARAQSLLRAGRKGGADSPRHEVALEVLQQNIESLQAQMEDRRQSPAMKFAIAPRACLNLEKRSQALRMHRRGESPAQIATLLEIPLQEVELLLKVHRIVLRGI